MSALGVVAPTYNVSGINSELKFTPQALAGIFLGITKWNDPATARANSGSKLPLASIVVTLSDRPPECTLVVAVDLDFQLIFWSSTSGNV